jgi:hypothetical protein
LTAAQVSEAATLGAAHSDAIDTGACE